LTNTVIHDTEFNDIIRPLVDFPEMKESLEVRFTNHTITECDWAISMRLSKSQIGNLKDLLVLINGRNI